MKGFSGNQKPSFFKILLEPTAKFLPLPPEFVRGHRSLPRDIVLRTTPWESYSLKIKKIGDGRLALCDGWHKVVEDKGLVFGDFIVFWLVNPSTFDVLFYGHSACQKSSSSSTLTNAPRIVKDEVDVSDTEEMNDDDFNETQEDEEDDLEDEDEMFNGTKKISAILSRKYHPNFRRELIPTHKFAIPIPNEFVKETGTQAGETVRVVVKNRKRKVWRVNVVLSDKRLALSGNGWVKLREENGLLVGDFCIFQFIKPGYLNLVIERGRARRGWEPSPERSREDGDRKGKREDVEIISIKRKRGRPRKQQP